MLASDGASNLPGRALDILRETGLMQALRPREYGGDASEPGAFFAGVVAMASAFPALGWVAGVLGVHAFEIALSTPGAAADVWRDSSRDNWIASPFTQSGHVEVVPGGYLLSGHWDYSSGFEIADWLCIGGMVPNESGELVGRNFCLPRSAANLVSGSWEVVGLLGSGSVSFDVAREFVPAHRVYDPEGAINGDAWKAFDYGDPVYKMPRQTMLSTAISASTLGAGLGLSQSVVAMTSSRLKGSSKRQASRDPYILRAIAEAEGDVEAGISLMLADLECVYLQVKDDKRIAHAERMRIKRNLVRSVHRSGQSLNELFTMCGGGALRLNSRPQIFWRDFQAGRNHNSHIYDWYSRYGHELFGLESQGGVV